MTDTAVPVVVPRQASLSIGSSVSNALTRFIRSALTVLIGAYVARIQNDPRYLVLAPAIQMIFKFLRDKFPNAGFLQTLPF